MKPHLLFKAMRQSQRDKRIHAMRRRPRLLMPVDHFVDTRYPHTLTIVNCQWYHGIQNMVMPTGAAPQTRNIVRIDVEDPGEPAYLLMQGFATDGVMLDSKTGYRVEWNGRVWLKPELFKFAGWFPINWNEFDWVVQ